MADKAFPTEMETIVSINDDDKLLIADSAEGLESKGIRVVDFLSSAASGDHEHVNMDALNDVSGVNTGDETKASIDALNVDADTLDNANLSADGTFASNSDALIPTEQATKTYVDSNTSTGLEALDETNGIGWRLVDRDPANYGNIGLEAVDLSYSGTASITYGATNDYGYAEGYQTIASGAWASHAEGWETVASGGTSHAEGQETLADGAVAHAEGWGTIAHGAFSHAEGSFTTSNGTNSHAEGVDTVADDFHAHAEGDATTASGQASHAEGEGTVAVATASHAEGTYNIGLSNTIHETGIGTGVGSEANAFEIYTNGRIRAPELTLVLHDDNTSLTTKEYVDGAITAGSLWTESFDYITAYTNKFYIYDYGSVVAPFLTWDNIMMGGSRSLITKEYVDAEITALTTASGLELVGSMGWRFIGAVDANHGNVGYMAVDESFSDMASSTYGATGTFSHASGYLTTASNQSSHAEGQETTASGMYSHAQGYSTSSGDWGSHAEGDTTQAHGYASHAEGYATQSNFYVTHAEGEGSVATGEVSHAEGEYTQSVGFASHAEGNRTTATGQNGSHAEGNYTESVGEGSHAEGNYTESTGSYSHAEGTYSVSTGTYSHAEGDHTVALNSGSHACGRYNVGTLTTTIMEVGIGSIGGTRNGLEVYLDGSVVAPELTTALIDTARSLVTKEYADASAYWIDDGMGYVRYETSLYVYDDGRVTAPDLTNGDIWAGGIRSLTTKEYVDDEITDNTFTLSTPPSASNVSGAVGDRVWDENYLYICTATDTWKRTALNTW